VKVTARIRKTASAARSTGSRGNPRMPVPFSPFDFGILILIVTVYCEDSRPRLSGRAQLGLPQFFLFTELSGQPLIFHFLRRSDAQKGLYRSSKCPHS
jgi:hypothetical protein